MINAKAVMLEFLLTTELFVFRFGVNLCATFSDALRILKRRMTGNFLFLFMELSERPGRIKEIRLSSKYNQMNLFYINIIV